MANQIVTVNVNVQAAPAPSLLQQKAAFISHGSTNLAANSLKLLTQPSDLTALLPAALPVTTLSWSGAVVTATVATLPAHLDKVGLQFPVTIAGAVPTGYNGQYLATVATATTFTFPLAVNPGTETAPGTYTVSDELLAMVTTFFAQGSQLSAYVLELGEDSSAAAVTALAAYITATPNVIYAYLTPRSWDSESTFLPFSGGFSGTTAKTYFVVTTTTSTYSQYTKTHKEIVAMVEAPLAPPSEFSAAAVLWNMVHYLPSGTNRVTPMAFAFLFGVTAYPSMGNSALLAALQAANINYVGSAAEGGLTNTMLLWGVTADGNDFSYWYSVDWAQTNIDLNISNAVINGSNNPLNPLYYDQNGINRLQDVALATIQSAITFGMATGTLQRSTLDAQSFQTALDAGTFDGANVVNAIPFLLYTKENTSDFAAGRYAGFSVGYISSRGFKAIVFNVLVTQLPSQ